MKTLCAVLIAVAAYGQPVYLRSSGPAGFTVTSLSNTTPVVVTTLAAHGLSVGDTVGVWGTCVAGGTTLPNADGIRLVKQVLSSTTFSITDLAGADIVGNGAWCDGHLGGEPGGAQWGGKLTQFHLADQPRGWLDGLHGAASRSVAVGTDNGLLSLVVAGSTATAVTSFAGYVSTGDQLGVWGSGNTSLNNSGNPYTVTVDSPTQFHFTVSGVSAGTYSGSNMVCGPSGTADCLRLSVRAWAGNPAWDELLVSYNLFAANSSLYMGVYDGGQRASSPMPNDAWNVPEYLSACALKAFVDRGDTNAINCGLYWLNHVERTHGVNFAAVETLAHGGDPHWGDFASYMLHDEGLIYSLLRGYLTLGQRQTFLDKIYNDLADGCNKVIPVQPAGATATFTATSYANNATAGTLAGTGTLWQTDSVAVQRVTVGDSLQLGAWNTEEYYVTAVNSDTSLSVIAYGNVASNSGGATYIVHAWKTGDCGALWLKKHWQGESGAQPVYYPPDGSSQGMQGPNPAMGGNNGFTQYAGYLAMDLAAASDDLRAVRHLAEYQSYWFDYDLRYLLNYDTGFVWSGSYYSYARVMFDGPDAARFLNNGVLGYPSMDLQGNWVTRQAMQKIYAVLPDNAQGAMWPTRWGAQTGDNRVSAGGGSLVNRFVPDGVFALAPASTAARWLKGFLAGQGFWTASAFGKAGTATYLLNLDPRQGSLDYTALPTQYVFRDTSQPTCAALTGWACPPNFAGNAMISRGGWSNANASHLLFEARGYWDDHDVPEAGSVRLYKSGYLLSSDQNPSGAAGETDDPTKIDTVPEIGGAKNLQPGAAASYAAAVAQMPRWAGQLPTGDYRSRYAYAMADLTGMYLPAANATRVNRHVAHFKGGIEEVIVQYDDIALGVAGSIRGQVHYVNNGEAATGSPLFLPAEGQTTCPGPNGCGGLDLDRWILSQQGGTVPNTNGLITRIFSPGTVVVRDDGSGYTGANGHTHRISICGGSACGTAVSVTDYMIVHKVSASMSKTTLTAAALNPNANWTGVQTTDKVAMFARGGQTYGGLSFTSTHSGIAQYLIAGLTPGTYNVMVSGIPVLLNAPVNAGDNTLYFESVAGTVVVGTGPVTISGTHMDAAGIQIGVIH